VTRTKREVTEALVQALDKNYPVDLAMSNWWYNRRENGGLRLTDTGAAVLKGTLELEHYEFKIKPEDLDSKTLIALDRNLTNPYYIGYTGRKPSWIIFFGSKDATMAYLYDDLKLFARNMPTGRKK